jgi:hypothetical protein
MTLTEETIQPWRPRDVYERAKKKKPKRPPINWHTFFANYYWRFCMMDAARNRARWQQFVPPSGADLCPGPKKTIVPSMIAEKIKALVCEKRPELSSQFVASIDENGRVSHKIDLPVRSVSFDVDKDGHVCIIMRDKYQHRNSSFTIVPYENQIAEKAAYAFLRYVVGASPKLSDAFDDEALVTTRKQITINITRSKTSGMFFASLIDMPGTSYAGFSEESAVRHALEIYLHVLKSMTRWKIFAPPSGAHLCPGPSPTGNYALIRAINQFRIH